jgi:hypothetical protein
MVEAMRRFLDDHGIEADDLGPEALKAYIAREARRESGAVVEAALRLVAARVVVDKRDGVQLPAHRGLELAMWHQSPRRR